MPIVNEPLLLGLEIGGTKLQLVAGASPRHILLRQRLIVDRTWGAAAICEQIKAALAQWAGIRWRAAGIGFGGPVDWRSGRICCSHQVDGWKDLNLRSWLENLIDAPVAVENDANLAALAEARYGAGYDFTPVFYTNSGSGVGGGLIVDGQIYHGASPGEAEFGQLRLAPDGLTVEDHCSGWAVDRKIRELCDEEPLSELAEVVGLERGGEARQLAAALALGNKAARKIVEETASILSFALSHVVHLIHPQVIVLGGGLALLGEPWRASIAQGLPVHLVAAFRPGPKVRLAALGEDVVPCGALVLAGSLDVESVSATEPHLDGEPIP